MPLLGFTKLLDKLLDGSKTQTIRKPRKHPIQVGDKLFIYWKLRTKNSWKMGEAKVVSIVRKRFEQITDKEFIADGFRYPRTAGALFSRMYRNFRITDVFDIITFEWTMRTAAFIKQRVERRREA